MTQNSRNAVRILLRLALWWCIGIVVGLAMLWSRLPGLSELAETFFMAPTWSAWVFFHEDFGGTKGVVVGVLSFGAIFGGLSYGAWFLFRQEKP
jgi:hypothetical protein